MASTRWEPDVPDRKLLALIALLCVTMATPALATRQHRVQSSINTSNLYAHNYGPGYWPGTVATYDGPVSALCARSAAAYRGQDGRRHPCN
jgi:hypothetical protein